MTVPMQPMLARRQLRLSIVADLKNKVEGVTVYSPGNWPTAQENLPALLVKASNVRKQSAGRNVPQFTTVITVQVEGRLAAATPEDAQDAIERLEFQVEQTILTGHWTKQIVQQFPSVTSDSEVNSEGKTHLAGFRMVIECETFEVFDETVFFPDESTWPPADPVIAPFEGVNLHLDTAQPFDATGTYSGTPFPTAIPAAPRTTGPDGRDEGYVTVDLPQT